ncbi:MAG TPA: uroporphyrinogen-III synthase [Thermoanaerobaculia bacterium]|jgi:uroporphyrinogen-III synthase|nr:uroporphyrinogen-III synthase [Thermoanaerobaculia bacterium]
MNPSSDRLASPLAGLRVVVTRAAAQATELTRRLTEAGATVISLPLIEVLPPADPRPLARAASELPLYDWVVFTSANGARALLDAAEGSLPTRLAVAVVGSATAAVLREAGIEPRIIATKGNAEALLADLAPHVAHRRVLLPQAADARPLLARGLEAAGADLTFVIAYDKRLPPETPARAVDLFSSSPFGWVTFTSGGIARRFADLFGDAWPQRRAELLAASIGPVTSAEFRALGVEPAVEAVQPTDEALVAGIVGRVAVLSR